MLGDVARWRRQAFTAQEPISHIPYHTAARQLLVREEWGEIRPEEIAIAWDELFRLD